MTHWAFDSIFYHIYPLGFCGAPERNDFNASPTPRLEQVYAWLDHIQWLGANALYLGPLFEATAHGYDTADYFYVDRRLGTNETLSRLSAEMHRRGMRLVLDGVFNHVGRDFWAFRDVIANRESSPFCGWFQNLSFGGRSPYGDTFSYEGWNGNFDLVKLNLHHPEVRSHLFEAISFWVREFDIDGLRLDTADHLAPDFLRDLSSFCRSLKPDFWLMGEVVAGDYRRWANGDMLASVTNYECYKGLYSSHVDRNYFEIAYALNRQFGPGGIYRELPLYNFADNHDVNRVASNLSSSAHLYPLHCLLFTMPGVPSVYYGSEWGIEGVRSYGNDYPLRPHLDLADVSQRSPNRDLAQTISRLASIRHHCPALRYGDYIQLHVGPEQFAFCRGSADGAAVVMVNAADQPAELALRLPGINDARLLDLLNPGEAFNCEHGQVRIPIPPCWGRILVRD